LASRPIDGVCAEPGAKTTLKALQPGADRGDSETKINNNYEDEE
jgi:hypothetical protein